MYRWLRINLILMLFATSVIASAKNLDLPSNNILVAAGASSMPSQAPISVPGYSSSQAKQSLSKQQSHNLTAQQKAQLAQQNEQSAGNTQHPAKSHHDEASQFSEMAFSNSSNAADDLNDTNVTLRGDKDFGTVVAEDSPVYGLSLFKNQCNTLKQMRFINPHYRLTVGDQVNVQIWGAFQFNHVMTIDHQGNIFIPEVGPVKLAGVENSQLNEVLKLSLKRVFLKDVHIYGDLITAQPVQVYVTGHVKSPGLYEGLSSDSVIYYLCKAGGINPKEGSFREIKVVRNRKVIHTIDLYKFLLSGNIENFQLHQGDTVFVSPMKYAITASGNVKSHYQYEFTRPDTAMSELIDMANLNSSVTHVRVLRHQGLKPKLDYVPLRAARRLRVTNGTHVVFVSDQQIKQVIVTVTGEVSGKHQYVLPEGTSLDSLLRRIRYTSLANTSNTQLFRESVAKQQKAALDSSLSRLERQILTTPSVTADGARIQAAQSQMVMKFIEEAKKVKFQGQVVLGKQAQWKQIRLQNNDVVNVPRRSSVVTVSGDVLNSLSVEVNPRYDYSDYINAAGGFTETGDKNKVLLVHQNGRIELLKHHLFGRKARIVGGDQIIVLPKVQSESWQVTESLTRILYQIGLSARIALAL